jgi:galactokinase
MNDKWLDETIAEAGEGDELVTSHTFTLKALDVIIDKLLSVCRDEYRKNYHSVTLYGAQDSATHLDRDAVTELLVEHKEATEQSIVMRLKKILELQKQEVFTAETLEKIAKYLKNTDFSSMEGVASTHKGLNNAESAVEILRRMRHQLTSAIRVQLASLAQSKGNVEDFGALINAEGVSLSEQGDFKIAGEYMDILLKIAFETAKEKDIQIFGRMLGGGDGGNVYIVVNRDNVSDDVLQDFWKQVTQRYNSEAKELAERLGDKSDINAVVRIPKPAKGISSLPTVMEEVESKVLKRGKFTIIRSAS